MQFLLGVSNGRMKESSAKYIEKVQLIRGATNAVGEEQQVPSGGFSECIVFLRKVHVNTAYSKWLLEKGADDQHQGFGLNHS